MTNDSRELHIYQDDGHRGSHSTDAECRLCKPEAYTAYDANGQPTGVTVYEHGYFDDFGL